MADYETAQSAQNVQAGDLKSAARAAREEAESLAPAGIELQSTQGAGGQAQAQPSYPSSHWEGIPVAPAVFITEEEPQHAALPGAGLGLQQTSGQQTSMLTGGVNKAMAGLTLGGIGGVGLGAAGVAEHAPATTIPSELTPPPKDSLAGMLDAAIQTFDQITRNWQATAIRPGRGRTLAPLIQDLSGAVGLVFLDYRKAGLGIMVEIGQGFAMARLADGTWSAPAAVRIRGASAGVSIGFERLRSFVLLQDPIDVETLMQNEIDREFDADLALVAGSGFDLGTGKNANFGKKPRGAKKNRAYGISRGLIMDISLGGLKIVHNEELNQLTYGPTAAITPAALLGGQIPQPPKAKTLVTQIETFLAHAKEQYQF